MRNLASSTSDGSFFEDADESLARHRYQTLLNRVADGIYQLSSDYRFVAVNDAFAATTGYQRSELLGKHVSSLFETDDVKRIVDAVVNQRDSSVELSVLTASGDRIACVATISQLSTETEFQGSLGVVDFGDEIDSSTPTAEQESREFEANPQQARSVADRVHRISHDVMYALILESTRADLEEMVCERLTGSTAFDFAWLGDRNQQTGRFANCVSAPADCGFDVAAIPFDTETGERPEATAYRTRAVQVVTAGAETDEWMQACGYRSMAAIPIVYNNVCYGLVAIYDESPNAVVDADREPLAQLGESIGHAITAIDRKNALVSDSVLQLVFSQHSQADPQAASEWTIDCERLVPTDLGIVAYGSVEGLSHAALEEVVADSTRLTDLRVLSAGPDEYEIELTMRWGTQLVAALAEHGSCVTAIRIGDGTFEFSVEAAAGQDKHRLVELVQAQYPEARLRSQRTVARENPAISDFQLAFKNRLTMKQRAALKTAFHAGYFEWPRQSTGEEVAERLGITQATFCEHFREAERVLFETVFERSGGDNAVPDSPWEPTESDSQS